MAEEINDTFTVRAMSEDGDLLKEQTTNNYILALAAVDTVKGALLEGKRIVEGESVKVQIWKNEKILEKTI